MIEKKIINLKKDELAIHEFIKNSSGKGKISDIRIERTPIGERVTIVTSRPGGIIGKKGANIQLLTESLKTKFKLQNPKIEIEEVSKPEFDAQTVADQIAMQLERFGTGSFKIVAYRSMERIRNAGALGCEINLSGKLPSEKARSWRFHFGYLKKTGQTAELVNRAQAVAHTKPGTTGIKVAILPPDVHIPDRLTVEVAEAPKEIVEEVVKEAVKEVVEKKEVKE